jgi:hypothetical protein
MLCYQVDAYGTLNLGKFDIDRRLEPWYLLLADRGTGTMCCRPLFRMSAHSTSASPVASRASKIVIIAKSGRGFSAVIKTYALTQTLDTVRLGFQNMPRLAVERRDLVIARDFCAVKGDFCTGRST